LHGTNYEFQPSLEWLEKYLQVVLIRHNKHILSTWQDKRENPFQEKTNKKVKNRSDV